jgi:hypothetical protein
MINNIIQNTHYQGIPLATEHGPFLEIRLADSLTTIENIMNKSRRIIVFCMEVLVPVSCGMGSSLYDDPVPQFVAKLQKQARWKHTQLHGQKTRLHVPIIDGIWQEVMTPQGRTGYRIMLLLNREAYDEQSIGFDAANTLQYRARMAWAKVNQIPTNQSGAYIRFPNRGLLITDNSTEGFCQVFAKASTLCTEPAQLPGGRYLGFGSTQKNRIARRQILPARVSSE